MSAAVARTGKPGRTRRAAWLCLLVVALAGCCTAAQASSGVFGFLGGDAGPSAVALRAALKQEQSAPLHDQLETFYAARDFEPVWSGDDATQMHAERVRDVLEHARQEGLRSADYPLPQDRPKPGRAAALYDLAFTRALLRYAHDVRLGRVKPDAVYKYVRLPPQKFDAVAALSDALDDDALKDFLARLPPPHPQYRMLESALAHYRAIEALGGWPVLSHPSRKALTARLKMEDYRLAEIVHPSKAEIKVALIRFQKRHGLDADGVVGPDTLKALNVPASYRVQEIEANMERWRWMPRQFESRYIRVNVPDQSVDFVVDGKAVLHSKAVVGRQTMPTPILRTQALAVIANPPWNIPDDIAAKSIVPHLRRDADYLKSRNMVLVDAPKDADIDWQKVTGGALPYQIREQPGPHNALGKIMFDMPNEFYVYLHGTPNEDLFKLDDRERSHGCVRVQKIVGLARLALAPGNDDPAAVLKAALDTDDTQRLALRNPLPVYMVYWTARVTPDGTVEFRPDRYDRDKPLIAALKAGPARVAKTDAAGSSAAPDI